MKRNGHKTRGQSLVEVAIAFPVMIMLFAGVVEFGFIINYYLSLVDATREAARTWSGDDPFLADGVTDDDGNFYYQTAYEVQRILDPTLDKAGYKGRKIVLDPTLDDVIVTVYAASYTTAAGDVVESVRNLGPYHLFGDHNVGNYPSMFTTQDILNTRVCGAPNAGILVVEVHYNYHHVLGLPWMTTVIPNPLHLRKTSERGQAIILVAFAIIGMVAMVGLMTDGGIVLIEYARLKRGIDSASIAAAAQFRKGFDANLIKKAGEEFLQFNQSTSEVVISICDPDHSLGTVVAPAPGARHDQSLCFNPPRKLVRITARRHVDFGFMRVVGMNGTDVTATAVGEAASIDMVLVIDTSTSMAYETHDFNGNIGAITPAYPDPSNPQAGNPGDDPEICNAHMGDGPHGADPDLLRRCEPMGKVIDAAVSFVDELFFPYDRVALVATTGQAGILNSGIGSRVPVTVLDFSDNLIDVGQPNAGTPNTEVQDAIHALRVYQPGRCPFPLVYDPNNLTPCLKFRDDNDAAAPTYYRTQICIPRYIGDPSTLKKNPITCGPSNIGGGLYEAGYQYANARQDSFWVTIALFGGPANASNPPGYANGICKESIWVLPGGAGFCRDEDSMPASYTPPAATFTSAVDAYTKTYMASYNWAAVPNTWPAQTRHHFTIDTSTDPDTYVYPPEYDADDFARDGADYVTSPTKGQGATIFSICMGSYCRRYPNIHDPASAELLGRYMAYEAGDSVLPTVTANHGSYYYAENSSDLGGPNGVFAKIAENIFTRISQ
ncbi:MAG: pilus assembly protein [Actinobacteria bacterium]|nr:pilus assembly protein [Actinomycetota bacterium]